MIQFNLLPEVKIAYIKAQRQKRLVLTVSFIVSAAAVALFLMLFTFVHGVQKKSMNDLTDDISTHSKELIETPNLNKMLTVQSQLSTLDQLHSDKVVSSRLFGYLQQVTPSTVSISQLKVDYAASTMEITGGAPTLAIVRTYADSLKTTQYTTKESKDKLFAFKNVVLSGYDISDDGGPTYTFTLAFDPAIFQQDKTTELIVKKTADSRSESGASSSVFQQNSGGQ